MLGLDSMTLQILSYLLINVALLWLLQVDCNFLNKTQYSGPWLNVFKLGNTDVVTAILFVWKKNTEKIGLELDLDYLLLQPFSSTD